MSSKASHRKPIINFYLESTSAKFSSVLRCLKYLRLDKAEVPYYGM